MVPAKGMVPGDEVVSALPVEGVLSADEVMSANFWC
jgi:hypothetical protein